MVMNTETNKVQELRCTEYELSDMTMPLTKARLIVRLFEVLSENSAQLSDSLSGYDVCNLALIADDYLAKVEEIYYEMVDRKRN